VIGTAVTGTSTGVGGVCAPAAAAAARTQGESRRPAPRRDRTAEHPDIGWILATRDLRQARDLAGTVAALNRWRRPKSRHPVSTRESGRGTPGSSAA